MQYSVKEIYYTLQGEGAHSGRPAVFLRFSGCNLWSGREEDRTKAVCQFCDTDFVGTNGTGGGTFTSPEDLAESVAQTWHSNATHNGSVPFVVCTGGEPLLQLDENLIAALHQHRFEIAVETNGTIEAPAGIDWLCCSPKFGAKLVQKTGQELKLVFPQEGGIPDDFAELDFEHYYLQPMDGPNRQENTDKAIEYCRRHPHWHLSLQSHKLLGIR